MSIREKIESHFLDKKYSRITRLVSPDWEEVSRGYIVDYSDSFIVLQESEDFLLLGFNILPIKQIKRIRYNNHDRYYDKIMSWEGQKANLGIKTKVDLSSWEGIFNSFLNSNKYVIVECENPDIDSFTIGPITKVTDRSVYILYFDAVGFFNHEPTEVLFKDISKVMFDDRYIEVFSKYTRIRKIKISTNKD